VRWPVYDEADAEAYVKEIVVRAERRKTLRARWDRQRGSADGRIGVR